MGINWKLRAATFLAYLDNSFCLILDGCWCHITENRYMVKIENDKSLLTHFRPIFISISPEKIIKPNSLGNSLAMLSLISDASADVQNLIPWVPFAVYCPSLTWMSPYEKAQNHELLDSFANLFQMFYLQCRGFNSYFDCNVLSNILNLPNPWKIVYAGGYCWQFS